MLPCQHHGQAVVLLVLSCIQAALPYRSAAHVFRAHFHRAWRAGKSLATIGRQPKRSLHALLNASPCATVYLPLFVQMFASVCGVWRAKFVGATGSFSSRPASSQSRRAGIAQRPWQWPIYSCLSSWRLGRRRLCDNIAPEAAHHRGRFAPIDVSFSSIRAKHAGMRLTSVNNSPDSRN